MLIITDSDAEKGYSLTTISLFYISSYSSIEVVLDDVLFNMLYPKLKHTGHFDRRTWIKSNKSLSDGLKLLEHKHNNIDIDSSIKTIKLHNAYINKWMNTAWCLSREDLIVVIKDIKVYIDKNSMHNYAATICNLLEMCLYN